MSTALAIASVTLVLKDLLNNGLIDHDITGTIGGNVTVSCLPPDLITVSANEPAQLNLFMYHVTPNTGWRNENFPSLNSSGERISNPPLALNLHYLLTAFCSNELHTEILLGYGMQLLHENPVLIREAIKKSLALPTSLVGNGLPVNLQALSTSKLADQVEQVKITPETINAEELSKLWTAFQTKFRPSAAYLATVVLIESSKSTKMALPVKARNIYVKPFKQPVIEKIKSKANGAAPITDNQKILQNYLLVIEGFNLQAENLSINIDGTDFSPAVSDVVTDTQIIFQLPADLRSGIHGLQVTSQIKMGTPEVLHRGVESNIEAFVLSPGIDPDDIVIDNLQGSGTSLRSANIKLNISPAPGDNQRIILLLNQVLNAPGTIPFAYSFRSVIPLSPPAPPENIVIPISAVKAGTYLIRILVDGAESPLNTIIYSPVNAELNGIYNSPLLIIP